MRTRAALLIVLATAAPAVGQTLATTLDALCHSAGSIARVHVLDVRQEGPLTRVRLAVTERVRGAPADVVTLTEPAGRACGRALHGVLPGAGYLAFLDTDGTEPRLAAASPRALVALEPGLLEHVRALLDVRGADRVERLASALDHRSPRIRDDAALALQVAPDIDRASPRVRQRIVSALSRALPDPTSPVIALTIAAVRTGEPSAAELLVPFYLRGERPELDRAVLRALDHVDDRELARQIPADADAAHDLRLRQFVRILQPEVAAAVLRLPADDVRRARATSPPEFRSIDPRRIR